MKSLAEMARILSSDGGTAGEWFDFPGHDGFRVKLAFLDADARTKLIRAAKKAVQTDDAVDFSLEIERKTIDAKIVDWSGLTADVLAALFPGGDFSDVPASGLPCTSDNRWFLSRNCPAFSRWATKLTDERDAFVAARKRAELGNS